MFPFPEEMPASARDAQVPVSAQSLPVTVISDGRLVQENLKKAGKEEHWLQKQLQTYNCRQSQVFLMTVDGENRVFLVKKEAGLRRKQGG